jgi:isocitrate dehydrogenase (NAD+)
VSAAGGAMRGGATGGAMGGGATGGAIAAGAAGGGRDARGLPAGGRLDPGDVPGGAPRAVTLLPGGGAGRERMEAVVRVLEAARVPLHWEWIERGGGARAAAGPGGAIEALLDAAVASIRRTRLALKGPLGAPPGWTGESPGITLRKVLDLYANVRPVRAFPGRPSRVADIDLVVVRENTEGEYAGLEHQVVPGVVESIKVTTEWACARIARFAFAWAARAGRRKVTAVHKANIMKRSDGLFLECCRAAAAAHPAIAYQELIVDNTCMQLVMRPEQLDLMVMQNLYGDLVSDLCAGLAGGPGVVPGMNLGDDTAVFEPIHADAAARAAAGRDTGPFALLVAALALLRHAGLDADADRVTAATAAVLREGRHTTPDLGGAAGTREMGGAIVARLGEDAGG